MSNCEQKNVLMITTVESTLMKSAYFLNIYKKGIHALQTTHGSVDHRKTKSLLLIIISYVITISPLMYRWHLLDPVAG